jgi:hypothetical protein
MFSVSPPPSNPQNCLKLTASGDVDGTMLEALEDYVKAEATFGHYRSDARASENFA